MPATDLVLVVYRRLLTLALASGGFTANVRDKNLVRYDVATILWPKNISSAQAADATKVVLDVGTITLSPLSKRTFCGLIQFRIVPFTWTIVGSSLKIIEIGQVRAEVESVMATAGQDLGIPTTVARVDPLPSPYEASPARISGIPDTLQGASAKQIRSAWAVTIRG